MSSIFLEREILMTRAPIWMTGGANFDDPGGAKTRGRLGASRLKKALGEWGRGPRRGEGASGGIRKVDKIAPLLKDGEFGGMFVG